MARPARRGWGLFFTAGLLLLVGSNVQAGWLFALASLLLGVIAAGLVMPRGMIRGVDVERRAPAEAFAGAEITVDLVLHNITERTKLSLVVEDDHIAPATAFIPSLGPGERVVVTQRRQAARRGIVDAGDLLLWSDAPFGIATCSRLIPAPGRTVVFPRVVSISSPPDLATAAKPIQEALMRSRKGAGHDFLGIRELGVLLGVERPCLHNGLHHPRPLFRCQQLRGPRFRPDIRSARTRAAWCARF